MIHVMNQERTPAVERAAEHERLAALQLVGKRVEWNPDDGYGVRRGVVTGCSRYDEGAGRIGALVVIVRRDEGERAGREFGFTFSSKAWKELT